MTTSLQDIKSPVVTLKDRKLLMELYRGHVIKPKMLQRLIHRGLLEKNAKGNLDFSIKAKIVIEFILNADAEYKRKQDARRSAKQTSISRAKARERDSGTLANGELL